MKLRVPYHATSKQNPLQSLSCHCQHILELLYLYIYHPGMALEVNESPPQLKQITDFTLFPCAQSMAWNELNIDMISDWHGTD